ncbi:MAG: phosphatidylglycerophosphatase A [Candidatus Eisenbacteria bacterium]|nr:phosphatidylglycerophosphatase A [Candidatus Eisenbacteria bacterium]
MKRAGALTLDPVARLLATGFFLGYSPAAPGTVGALGFAALLWFLVPTGAPAAAPVGLLVMLLSVLAFLALAIWAASAAERAFGHDSSRIVVDEFAGMLVAVLFLPKSLTVYGAAFVLFRIADILKPFPGRRVESLPGGLGVVADDVVAGLYANVLVRLMMAAGSW